ncbi:hypothetical protein [Novipirellula caenicola]|uniref:Stigma-specific protein, Stig1 n=1 Tax=Novipirellula caenicola TaxID=1536901 RepID=A0ABP9VKI4_9BACT
MSKFVFEFRPVNSVGPNHLGRWRSQPKSTLVAIWVSAVLLGGGSVSAEVPGSMKQGSHKHSSLQQLGRIVGAGWGDGYHACKCSDASMCADMPPRPYCEGNCGHGNCDACGTNRSSDIVQCDSGCALPKPAGFLPHGILGNVNETGVALKAGTLPACRSVPCNDLRCKSPTCKLKLQGNVNETGLALKATGTARYSKPLFNVSLPRPHFRTPIFRQLAPQPACDTTCDVNVGPAYPFPAYHNDSGDSIESTESDAVTDSPLAEFPADAVMNPSHANPEFVSTVESLATSVVEPEKKVAVSVLAAPQINSEPVAEVRHPVRIAQGKVKPRSSEMSVPAERSLPTVPAETSAKTPAKPSPSSTVAKPSTATAATKPAPVSMPKKSRIAISDPLPTNVYVNHFVETDAEVAAQPEPATNAPKRLPVVR